MAVNKKVGVWLRRLHGFATIAWFIMIPVSLLTGLKNSLPYIVGLSVYALFIGHFASWMGGRAESAADPGESS